MLTRFQKLTRAHAPSCPAPANSCKCTLEDRHYQEEKQYWATCILAVFAGVVGALIGFRYSMAALSDSLHAFADGFADMWGVRVMRKMRKEPHGEEASLRRRGTRVIAVLLGAAAFLVLHEAWDRYGGNGYVVSPMWILVAGIATSTIDIGRVTILSVAQSYKANEMRAALIEHAILDLRRSEAIAAMGTLMLIAQAASLFFSVNIETELQLVDLFISLVLVTLMGRVAYQMWYGTHSHGHARMHFERWLIKKVTGIEIPTTEQTHH